MSFFKTKEYHDLIKKRTQLALVNTDNNYGIYLAALEKAIVLCDKSYAMAGWDKNTGQYAWVKALPQRCGELAPSMLRCKQSDGTIFFVAKDCSRVVFKNNDGVYISYTEAELQKFMDAPAEDRAAIHKIKMTMEGELV